MIDTEILPLIDELNSREAEGCDGIPTNLLKAIGEWGKKCLVEEFKSIKMTGKLLDNLTKAKNVTTDIKMNASECAEHKTINPIAHEY